MKVKIVYGNEAKPGFESGWGFSAIIELEKEKILFDTGRDGTILLSNMRKMGLDPDSIDKIVLSHKHFDHIGGLTQVLKPGIDVYLPKSFSQKLKEKLKTHVNLQGIQGPGKITEGMWTTGELGKHIKEQSLAVETGKGIIVIVGCSHPGVEKILSAASRFGEIYGIIGGLHGFNKYEVLKDLKLVIATHCTKNKEKIKKIYPESFKEGKTGQEIDLDLEK